MKKINKKILMVSLMVVCMVVMTMPTVFADTMVQVTYSTPNPDIYVSASISQNYRPHHVWASVVGSGGLASGEIVVSYGPWASPIIAWQTADFVGGTYTTAVSATKTGLSSGNPTGTNSISHSFNVQGGTSSSVTQQATSVQSYTYVEGFQNYEAVGADLVIVGGLVEADHWTWDTPQSVTYLANAEGNVIGSQGSLTHTYQALGFGAGIQGTEETTIFEFNILTPTDWTIATVPAGSPAGTIHTVVIASDNVFVPVFSIFGEAHTWLETSSYDNNFNWIEP